MIKLDEFETDALKEICNIGVSHAANSLSTMVDKKIFISVPEIELPPAKKVHDFFGGVDSDLAGVKLKIQGDVNITLLLLFSLDNAFRLIDIITMQELGTTTELDEMGESALNEVGNILASHFTSSLADFLDFNMTLTPPELQNGSSNEIMKNTLENIDNVASQFLTLNTLITEETSDISGFFFLLPDKNALDLMLNRIKMKVGM